MSSYKQRISDLLTKAFERQKKQNNLLSLRAKASQMDLSPSYLSKILRGQKNVPLRLVPILEKGLHLDIAEVNDLQALILQQLEDEKATSKTGVASSRANAVSFHEYKDLTRYDFYLLEKWYHIPLLNLITLESFKEEPEWISARLGVSSDDIQKSLKELLRQGYLKRTAGRLEVSDHKARFPTDKSHETIRSHHKNMIKKAADVLDKETSLEDFENRLINGISFAGNSEKIKDAKVILNRALFEVAELLAQDSPNEVFQINLQFFKVTK